MPMTFYTARASGAGQIAATAEASTITLDQIVRDAGDMLAAGALSVTIERHTIASIADTRALPPSLGANLEAGNAGAQLARAPLDPHDAREALPATAANGASCYPCPTWKSVCLISGICTRLGTRFAPERFALAFNAPLTDEQRAALDQPGKPMSAGTYIAVLERERNRLRTALVKCVDLIEAWAYGPLFRNAGISYPAGHCTAPALLEAKRLLAETEGKA